MAKANGVLKIETGIPIPTTRLHYPFADMKIGDSFFVRDATRRAGIYLIAKRAGMRARITAVDGGIRVWRVA